jgi:hypothetical protein
MKKPNSIIITPFTKQEYQYWFKHLGHQFKTDPDITVVYLARLIAPRSQPGGNCFLIVPIPTDHPLSRYQFMVYAVVQVPDSLKYVIPDTTSVDVTDEDFEELCAYLVEERFCECLIPIVWEKSDYAIL